LWQAAAKGHPPESARGKAALAAATAAAAAAAGAIQQQLVGRQVRIAVGTFN
jgi:hypothetical protein